jgi:hypothetical protein
MGMAFVCVERDLRRGPIANSARRRREFAKSVGRQHKYPWGFSAIQIAHTYTHACCLFAHLFARECFAQSANTFPVLIISTERIVIKNF